MKLLEINAARTHSATLHLRLKKEKILIYLFSLPSAYFKVCWRGLVAGWVELCHCRLQDNTL